MLRSVFRRALPTLALALLTGPVVDARAQSATPEPPTSCRIGAYITSIHDIDTVSLSFSADAWLWSVCSDEAREPLMTMEFVNASSVAASLDSTTPVPPVYWKQRKIAGTFRHDFDLRSAPFDRHELVISLEEGVEDDTAFVYEFDELNSGISPELRIANWIVTGFRGVTRSAIYDTNFGDPSMAPASSAGYSRLDLEIGVARADLTGFLKLAVPAYISGLLALVSLFMQVEEGGRNLLNPRIGLLAASLFAVVFNLRAIDDVVGASPTLTMMDLIHFAALALICAATFAAIGSGRLIERGFSIERIRRLDERLIFVGGGIYVLVNILLIVKAQVQG